MHLPFGKTGKLLQIHSVLILVNVIKLQGVRQNDDDDNRKRQTTRIFFFIRKAHLNVSLHLGELKRQAKIEIQRSNIFRNTNNIPIYGIIKIRNS